MCTYRIWDKASPINGCPADEALQSLRLKPTEQLCILSQGGQDCVTQTFPSSASEADIKAWVDKYNADTLAQQQAAEEAAKRPTIEQAVSQIQSVLSIDPIDTSTLEGAQKAKLREISNACEQTVFGGVDIATTKGTEHFSLTQNDQINITALADEIAKGAASVPYHGFAESNKEYKANPTAFVGSVSDAAEILRVSLTGSVQSPNLHEIIEILGKSEVTIRLNKVASFLAK